VPTLKETNLGDKREGPNFLNGKKKRGLRLSSILKKREGEGKKKRYSTGRANQRGQNFRESAKKKTGIKKEP